MKATIYKNYLLAVLLAILVFNKADNAVLGVLLQDIKVDLDLTDTQLGFLTGIAFMLFYSVAGVPLARWADRGDRVVIISVATALQCAAVALCGVAGSFLQLLWIRVGVAVGEAGCVPPANSLIAEHFTRSERARATARYMLGYPLSAIIGYLLAGWLNQHFGWRVTFVLFGLPGLALTALTWFTLREPRRGQPMGGPVNRLSDIPDSTRTDSVPPSSENPSLVQVATALWTNATFRHVLLGYSMVTFFGIGIWLWAPTFFIRSYRLETGEVGTWFAVIWGVGGLLGTYWGGELASSKRAVRNERLQFQVMAVVYVAFGALSTGIYLSPNHYIAFAFLGITAVANYAIHGPLFAAIQTLVQPHMRAMAFATLYMFANLIGMGVGPLAAGALSDALAPSFGAESLRYSLLALCPGYLWAAWHLFRASKTVTHDLEVLIRASTQEEQSTTGRMRIVLSEHES